MAKISNEIDPVFGIPISEDQAFERKKAMKALDAYQEPIAEHLILLFSAKPSSPDINGWEEELNAWRKSLVRRNIGKSGTKNFSTKDLVQSLWVEPLSTSEDRRIRIESLSQEKGMKIAPIEGDEVERFKKFVARYILCIEKNVAFRRG